MAEEFKDSLVGVKVKDWTITKYIAAGGFGAVLAVEKDDEKAIVKFPIVAGKSDFRREATTMNRVQSPTNMEDRTSNICKLLEYGTMDLPEIGRKDVEFLLQELCDGSLVTEIWTYLEQKRKDGLGHMAELLLQVLRAVWDLHQTGLVNRDIKQENLGYPAALKQVKMIDLGLAWSYVNPDGTIRLPDSSIQPEGTMEWCSFKAEYGYQQGRVDDLWAWFLGMIEVTYCYAGLPQAWSVKGPAEEGGFAGEMDPNLRLLMKTNISPGQLWMPSGHANMYRIRFYLETLGQTDTPDYFLLAQLTQEMRSTTKKRNKAAVSSCTGVQEHLQFIGNYFY